MLLKKLTLPRFFAVLTAVFMALTINGAARAQDSACDPSYLNALHARAFLEAQREIAQNQNLILKPDSVLEYTCFREALEQLAVGPPLPKGNFSESQLWGAIINQGPTSLDTALNSVVWAAAGSYLRANFNHNFLYNRSANDYDEAAPMNIPAVAYTCANMQTVWNDAQCKNFFDTVDDEFYDFDEYARADWDPRKRIDAATGNFANRCVGVPNNTHLVRAFNDDGAAPSEIDLYTENTKAAVAGLPPAAASPADFTAVPLYVPDPVVTYLTLISPVDPAPPGPGTGNCRPPIRTGVCVDRINVDPYADAVCPNPGCHYVPTPGNCNSVGTCTDP